MNNALFTHIQQAAWLLDKEDQVLQKTKLAEEVSRQYQISLAKILEIARGKGCLLHSTLAVCLDCPVGEVDPTGFPLVILDQAGGQVDFWGSLTAAGEDGEQLLQLIPQVTESFDNDAPSLFDYLNDAREKERKQIAQDLHDGIAQSIYSLMLETRGLKWVPQEGRDEHLAKIDRHFAEVLQEVKELAGELRPMSLDAFGLETALKQLASRTMEMTGFEVVLQQVGSKKPLTEAQRVALYRVIQEGITNALKYAQTDQVFVTLDYQGDYLAVTIQDHGQGFLVGQAHGFGLLNMQERMAAIGGTFTLHSQMGEGTEVLLRLPYEGLQEDEKKEAKT